MTIDDVLAAVYVNVVVLLVYAGKTLLASRTGARRAPVNRAVAQRRGAGVGNGKVSPDALWVD